MEDHDGMFFSPSGRFACRKGISRGNGVKWTSVHFLDFEEETYREIYLAIFKKYWIKHMYWLDDSTLGVFFNTNCDKSSIKPMMSIYKIVLSKNKLKRANTIYWNENEGFPRSQNSQFSEGVLTIQDKDYLVLTMVGTMNHGYLYPEDLPDPEFADLEQVEDYNGNSSDYIWIRLIPKTFESLEDTQKIWINFKEALKEADIVLDEENMQWSISAHKHNLYFHLLGPQFLILDVAKYLQILESTGRLPSLSEFSTGVKILSPVLLRTTVYCQNGNLFISQACYNGICRVKVWNLECNEVSREYFVGECVEMSSEEDLVKPPFVMVHPSGNILQIPYGVYRIVETSGYPQIETETEFELKFLPLQPISTELLPLQTLAKSQEILNRTPRKEKLPRCLREGRMVLNFTLTLEPLPVKKKQWWKSLKKRYFRFLRRFNSSSSLSSQSTVW